MTGYLLHAVVDCCPNTTQRSDLLPSEDGTLSLDMWPLSSLYYLIPLHYMVTVIIANIVAITNAYICYKFLVFKTRGNYLKEYLRFYVVYGGSMILGLTLLPLFVELLRLHPVVAQTIIIPIGIIVSYLGHKHFSFRRALQ